MTRENGTDLNDISVEQLQTMRADERFVLIDVRSEAEFEEASIPGCINIPIFTNEERAEVGTLYKQESAMIATERGLEIFAGKLPALHKQFRELPREKVVFCWRGGMRSKAMATFMSLMGMKCMRLRGGYRAYRQWVVDQLGQFQLKQPIIVINGHTGTGKTRVLQALEAEGYPVLDLEAMAGHRGSVFGHIGLVPSNQKKFDSLLFDKLVALQDAPYLLMEAESRRIGKVVVPDFLMEAKERGAVLFLSMPMAERVRTIIEDYKPDEHPERFLESFERIRSKLHTPIAAEVDQHLKNGQYAEAFALLLEYYYDPRYEYAAQKYPTEFHDCPVGNVEEGIDAIKRELTGMRAEMSDTTVGS